MILQFIFFFFNDTATTEIYTLSLHDALPICDRVSEEFLDFIIDHSKSCTAGEFINLLDENSLLTGDRKSTRLNSSHLVISYAVFCLKKKHTIKRCDATSHNNSGTGGTPGTRH